MGRKYQVITPIEVTDAARLYETARRTMLEQSVHVDQGGAEQKFVPDEDTIDEIIGTVANPKIEGCIAVLLAHDGRVTPGLEIAETFIVPAGPRLVN